MTPPAGRPLLPDDDRFSERFIIRISPADADSIRRHAGNDKTGTFLRDLVKRGILHWRPRR